MGKRNEIKTKIIELLRENIDETADLFKKYVSRKFATKLNREDIIKISWGFRLLQEQKTLFD